MFTLKYSIQHLCLLLFFLLGGLYTQAAASERPKLEWAPSLLEETETGVRGSNRFGLFYDYNDAFVKLSLGWPLVTGKFYPNASFDLYLAYWGFGLSFGKIYNQEALEAYDDRKNLGYYFEVDLYTKLTLLENRMLSVLPGFNYTHHWLTLIDPEDSVGFGVFSLAVKAEVLFFEHLGLSYKVNLPLAKSDDLRYRDSRFLQTLGVNYRFYVR